MGQRTAPAGARPPARIDAMDRKILRLLQIDSTISLHEIAREIGLSQTPCWKRIQRLLATGVIEKRAAILSPEALGFTLTVFLAIESGDHSQEWLERFPAEIAAMPEVMDFYRLAGDVDFMLRIVVPDIAAYDAFYKRLISTVALKSATSRFALERIKATTAYASI